MSSYTISNKLTTKKVFILQKSELEKRFDPAFYFELRNNRFEFAHPTKTISRIVKSYSGGTPNKLEPSYWNGDICWASPKDMKSFYLIDTQDKITIDGVRNSSTTIAPIGSVIIVFRSGILQHTLPVSVTKVETSINQDLKVLVPNEEILPEYLATFLKTFEKRILPRIVKHSTTVQSINQEEFNQLAIPIPKIEIQKQIIDINKEAIEIKNHYEAEAEKLLSSIDDYLLNELGIILPELPENTLRNRMFMSSLSELSGYRFDPFYYQAYYNSFFHSISDGKYPLIKLKKLISQINTGKGIYNYNDTGLSYLNVNNIKQYEIDKSGSPFVDIPEKDKYSQNIIFKGDILTGRVGTIGNFGIYQNDELALISDNVFCIRISNQNLDIEFTNYFLNSKLIKEQLNRNSRGAVQQVISTMVLNNLLIPCPSLSKQKEIAVHITAIRQQAQQLKDKTKELLEKANKEIEDLLIGNN